MEIRRKQLENAAAEGVLANNQVEPLWLFLKDQNRDVPDFRTTHIFYYLGGLIAIAAMTVFMGLGWSRFGPVSVLCICIIYGCITVGLTELLLRRYHLIIPANIFATLTLALIPLTVFSLLSILDYWDMSLYRNYYHYIDSSRLIIELATLCVGLVLIFIYRLPFLLMPIAFTLWYMSMDIVPALVKLLQGGEDIDVWQLKQNASLCFGLLMIVIAFIVDVKNRSPRDFACWLYLFGVLSFWVALSAMSSDDELGKFFYCCINILMIFIGGAINRRVFTIFGGIGVTAYLGYLSYEVFKESMLFPFALTLIGLSFVAIGVYWQRHEKKINGAIQRVLPKVLVEFTNRNY